MNDFSENSDSKNEAGSSYQPDSSQFPHYGYKPARNNSFMILSLCLGILSIATCSFCFFSLPAAGLSILFALLSRGSDKKLQVMPKAGIIISLLGILFSVVITVSAVYLVFTDPTYQAQLNSMCEQMYGQSFDDMMQEINPGYQPNGATTISENSI